MIRITYVLQNPDNVTAKEVARLAEVGQKKVIGKRVEGEFTYLVAGLVTSVDVEVEKPKAPKKKKKAKKQA